MHDSQWDVPVDVAEFEPPAVPDGYTVLVEKPVVPPRAVSSPTGPQTATVRFTPTSPQSYDCARLAVGSNDPDEPAV
jgi:hypothetical protein